MDCIALLEHMVRIPSLSGEEGELAAFLVRWAQEHGFDRAYVDEAGNAVAERGHPEARVNLVLLGHMDTVPGNIPVRVEDGILYGRGTVDAKGPLAAFFCAAAQADLPADTRIVVVGATEEEAATSKGARHIRDRFLKEGLPRACIIGEPSGWDRITLGYKGRLLVTFFAEEENAHTAGPRGLGVGDRACRWWQGVKALCEQFNRSRDRVFDQLLPSLRHVHTEGDGLNNRVIMHIGLRLPPSLERERLEEQLRALAGEVGGQVTFSGYEPAYRGDKRNALVRAFIRAIRAEGGKPAFKVKTGTSDMNVVGPAWNVPIVAYGPGDSRLDHTPEEHIRLDEFLRAIRVLRRVLEENSQQEKD